MVILRTIDLMDGNNLNMIPLDINNVIIIHLIYTIRGKLDDDCTKSMMSTPNRSI